MPKMGFVCVSKSNHETLAQTTVILGFSLIFFPSLCSLKLTRIFLVRYSLALSGGCCHMLTLGDRNATVAAGGALFFVNQHVRSVEREKKKKKSLPSLCFLSESWSQRLSEELFHQFLH